MTDLAPCPLDAPVAIAAAASLDALALDWLAGFWTVAPDRHRIARLRRGPEAELIGRLAHDPHLAPSLSALAAVLDDEDDDQTLAMRASIAWGRLFLGLGGPETVAPYESAFLGSGRLFQAPTSDMERLLAAHDLAVAVEIREPADHLGIELALMARLVATDHPDRRPLARRLAAWVPRFRDALAARDATRFHAAVADVLVAVIARETDAEETSAEPEMPHQRSER